MDNTTPARFRVIVSIDATTHPRLHATLVNIPSRRRGERLRHLAGMGLLVESGGIQTGSQKTAPSNNKIGGDELSDITWG